MEREAARLAARARGSLAELTRHGRRLARACIEFDAARERLEALVGPDTTRALLRDDLASLREAIERYERTMHDAPH
jgi:hypothetical protein